MIKNNWFVVFCSRNENNSNAITDFSCDLFFTFKFSIHFFHTLTNLFTNTWFLSRMRAHSYSHHIRICTNRTIQYKRRKNRPFSFYSHWFNFILFRFLRKYVYGRSICFSFDIEEPQNFQWYKFCLLVHNQFSISHWAFRFLFWKFLRFDSTTKFLA